MAAELQQLLSDLQRNPAFQDAAALQRIAARLQVELNAPRSSQPPVAPPVCLTPLQQQTWEAMQAFLALLCEYAGWVNRSEWLHLLDVAADLLARGPAGDTPYIGDNGTWWIGDVDTGVHPAGEPPTIGSNGNWIIGGVDTGVTAVGRDGADGAVGATGPAGPQGSTGATGSAGLTPYVGPNGNWWIGTTDTGMQPTGPQGLPGVPGATGPAGAQGIPGQGLIIEGQFNTSGDLIAAHPTGTEGQAFLVGVTDPKHLFVWFQGAWHDVGPLTGVGINEAPNTTAQPYARNGLSNDWELVIHDGGTF